MSIESNAIKIFPILNKLEEEINNIKEERTRAAMLGASLLYLFEKININDFYKETVLEKINKEFKRR